MEKTFLEKKIRKEAEKKFEQLEYETRKINNKILSGLKIAVANGAKLRLGVNCLGYNPSTDLLRSPELLKKYTNYYELKENIIREFEEEKTSIILKNLSDINYLFDKDVDSKCSN